ncbi:shikimate dehydrogenase [Microbacterium sp. G2-8]|uniref:shikimate dehydrogenase family protein n=1 Tax=Microbacterium sp. G2-8 TaxID=2842454 RepID=UPI001C896394|nr:shikimate dehydrogenase [Microbacterium sp. G2-8]
MNSGARLEVWGDPIGHSRSPLLHHAAYRALGLDWGFTRREVPAARFAERLAESRVRGIAVTYPLKEHAFRAAAWRGRRAQLTGVANTLFFGEPGDLPRLEEREGDGPLAFNTDVGGIALALREIGADAARSVRIIGAGATATSALVALSELDVDVVEIAARRPERAAHLIALGDRAGVAAHVVAVDDASAPVDLTIATLPGGTALSEHALESLSRRGGLLFDVAYSPWPTPLASAWGGAAHHGLPMLLHQAVLQVRIFVNGDPSAPVDDESAVVEAMRAALTTS